MGLCNRLSYAFTGTFKLAAATLCGVSAMRSSQQDYCLGGVYSFSNGLPNIELDQDIVPCSWANSASKTANFGSNVLRTLTGQSPYTTFSIPLSSLSTFVSGASSLMFAIGAIRDFSRAIF